MDGTRQATQNSIDRLRDYLRGEYYSAGDWENDTEALRCTARDLLLLTGEPVRLQECINTLEAVAAGHPNLQLGRFAAWLRWFLDESDRATERRPRVANCGIHAMFICSWCFDAVGGNGSTIQVLSHARSEVPGAQCSHKFTDGTRDEDHHPQIYLVTYSCVEGDNNCYSVEACP